MWDRLRRLIERDGQNTRARRPWHKHLRESHRRTMRIAVGLGALILLVSFFPRGPTAEYGTWREGMVAPREVIAPFSFKVRKNDVELEQDRARARNAVPPVLRLRTTVGSEQETRFLRFLDVVGDTATSDEDELIPRHRLHQQTIQWLLSERGRRRGIARRIAPGVIRTVYDDGFLPREDAFQLRDFFRRRPSTAETAAQIPEQVTIIESDGTEYTSLFSSLRNMEEVRDELGQIITRTAIGARIELSSEGVRALHNLIDSILEPNMEYDRELTIARQMRAASDVALFKRTIFKDERFVESHAVLTSDDVDELVSLMAAERERQGQEYRWQPIVLWVGRAIIVASIILIVAFYLRDYHPKVWQRPSWLVLCALLIALPLLVASYAAANTAIPVYIVPLALTPMLGTILFGLEVGVALAAGAILLAGTVLGFDFDVVLINAVAAVIAAFGVRNVRNRNQFLRSMLFLPLGIAAITLGIDAVQGTTVQAMWKHVWPGVVNGVSVPILSMGLLVVCEKFFNITTSITLLELSDLNSPLLRELSLRAPGTHTHSIIIANLAENAAEAIGASPLLARVGAYYHDLGKMQRPDHFVENQLNVRNPHDKLSPQMSALIVAAHVKDGIEIAERMGLPKQIIDFIPQHHGTLLIAYFYRKAQNMYGPENVREEAFRYPGPKPQTREAAILMMADAVEAAVRSLKDRTPSRVQGLVHQLVRERLDDGQFDECNLTLRELALIERSFLPVLAGTLHSRIEYPKAPATPTPLPHPSQEPQPAAGLPA